MSPGVRLPRGPSVLCAGQGHGSFWMWGAEWNEHHVRGWAPSPDPVDPEFGIPLPDELRVPLQYVLKVRP